MEGKREAITKIDWQVLKVKQEIRIHHPRNVGWRWAIESIHKATWWYFEARVQKKSDGNFGQCWNQEGAGGWTWQTEEWA